MLKKCFQFGTRLLDKIPGGGFSLRKKKCKHSDSLSCLKVWNLLLKNDLSDNGANLL